MENDLLDKCLFVMPPEQFFEGYSVFRPFGLGRASERVRVEKPISELWNDSLPQLESIGLRLPKYAAGNGDVGLFTAAADHVRRVEIDKFRVEFVLTVLDVLRDSRKSSGKPGR